MRTLQSGSVGEDVELWQRFLKGSGLYEGQIDGKFGPLCVAATQAFQTAHQLEADGVAGNKTLGVAMQEGLELAPPDVPLPGGPRDGVSSINDAWVPPPPPTTEVLQIAQDPRVITNHAIGVPPCPPNPPPPVGWAYWTGSVPEHVGKFALKVEFTSAEFPMGSFVQTLIDGKLVAARVEWHDFQGATGRHGVFRGTNLLRPKAPVA
ncbi:MAG TPA: peptidoglycan-binding domain-containing protein [Polyangiaceae bacterium]|nr:peptidoglycan-binding domain-containing protein [Polyangiaceae bacterium]